MQISHWHWPWNHYPCSEFVVRDNGHSNILVLDIKKLLECNERNYLRFMCQHKFAILSLQLVFHRLRNPDNALPMPPLNTEELASLFSNCFISEILLIASLIFFCQVNCISDCKCFIDFYRKKKQKNKIDINSITNWIGAW